MEPLRFTSHRDFARAFERAVRRAGVPIAFSQGFSPHPKISYASAAPTGVASEAEYLEIGLQTVADPATVRDALDAALSPGLDVLEAVEAGAGASLADRIDASQWRIELPEVEPGRAGRGRGGVRGRRRGDGRAADQAGSPPLRRPGGGGVDRGCTDRMGAPDASRRATVCDT